MNQNVQLFVIAHIVAVLREPQASRDWSGNRRADLSEH